MTNEFLAAIKTLWTEEWQVSTKGARRSVKYECVYLHAFWKNGSDLRRSGSAAHYNDAPEVRLGDAWHPIRFDEAYCGTKITTTSGKLQMKKGEMRRALLPNSLADFRPSRQMIPEPWGTARSTKSEAIFHARGTRLRTCSA